MLPHLNYFLLIVGKLSLITLYVRFLNIDNYVELLSLKMIVDDLLNYG